MSKIIYIAGYQRSGSTIIHNILSQAEGFFGAGELTCIWNGSFKDNKDCACGKSFNECDVWKSVAYKSFGQLNKTDIDEMINISKSVRTRELFYLLIPTLRRTFRKRCQPYLDQINKLYSSIFDITKCRAIVDSSKATFYGYLVSELSHFDTYTIHLVRDPRAVQQSLLKRKYAGHPLFLKHNPYIDAIRWCIENIFFEIFFFLMGRRVLKVKYEDFASSPKYTIRKMMHYINEDANQIPFVSDDIVRITPTHGVSGNESRGAVGEVAIFDSPKWRDGLTKAQFIIISIICFPMLWRYGYFDNKGL